jgi:hypothetical protein
VSVLTASRFPAGASGPVDSDRSVQVLARVTGAMYVALAVLGMLGPLTLESLLVVGDAEATAAEVKGSTGLFTASIGAWVTIVAVDVAISGTLYQLLAPAGRLLSLVSSAFRLTYSVLVGALLVHLFQARDALDGDPTATDRELGLQSLKTFSSGFLVALVFFGIHLALLGTLLLRSGYLPTVIGGLVLAAGFGYVVDSLASLTTDGYGGVLPVVLLTPAVLGEVGLALWLLVKGVRTGV